MRLGLIINPSAGDNKGKPAGEKVLDYLSQTEHLFVDLSGETIVEAEAQAKKAIAENLIDVLVVVGGDGMVFLGTNLCAETGIPLGIVAAGTGNDAATLFGMPLDDPIAGIQLILENLHQPVLVDAVSIQSGEKLSWCMGSASAGFDALVNKRSNQMKWPKGPNKYYVAMLLELAKFKPISYSLVVDGKPRQVQAMLCAATNTGVFGGGMLVSPKASIKDGMLDLFIVHKISRFELIRIFPKVYTGDHVTHPAVEIVRAKEVSIAAPNMPIYSDGEYVSEAPFTARVVPGAMKVIAMELREG